MKTRVLSPTLQPPARSARDRRLVRLRAIRAGHPQPAAGSASVRFRPGLDAGEVIGEGGFGTVQRGFDRGLGREVAVKCLRPEHAGTDEQALRFVEEAGITGRLEHPNVLPVHEVGVTAEGTLYFAMKLAEGRELADLIDALPEPRSESDLVPLVSVLVKVCDAIAYAHAQGVVHRDLKPENVLVGSFGQVYVMDWGLAIPAGGVWPDDPDALVEPLGSVVGTPSYMAPEQAFGQIDRIDARTDVFAIGGILYAILTGIPPYLEETTDEVVEAARRCDWIDPEELDPETIHPPRELARIARRALSREPGERHPSAEDLARELEGWLRGGGLGLPEVVFEPGAWIVEEGDEAASAYVIAAGRCEVVRSRAGEEVVLRTLDTNDVFGETAIFRRGRRSASVRAATRVRLIEVTRERLLGELGRGWIAPFVRTLAERFADHDAALETARVDLARARLDRSLLEAFARLAVPGPAGVRAPLEAVVERVAAERGSERAAVLAALEGSDVLRAERPWLCLRTSDP